MLSNNLVWSSKQCNLERSNCMTNAYKATQYNKTHTVYPYKTGYNNNMCTRNSYYSSEDVHTNLTSNNYDIYNDPCYFHTPNFDSFELDFPFKSQSKKMNTHNKTFFCSQNVNPSPSNLDQPTETKNFASKRKIVEEDMGCQKTTKPLRPNDVTSNEFTTLSSAHHYFLKNSQSEESAIYEPFSNYLPSTESQYSKKLSNTINPNITSKDRTFHEKFLPAYKKSGKRKRKITTTQRQAANFRERRRMSKLNLAFEELWKKMPDNTVGHVSSHLSHHIKLSRVFILKSALSYIEHLTQELRS